jgi:glycine/D-amino acid oxidase-like deaminating enzyme
MDTASSIVTTGAKETMATPLPHDDATCGWYRALPEPEPARRISGHEHADWVVLGAGFTGLAAARRLAELRPHDRILLIDAQRVGYGPSGRNAGFILETPHYTEGWPLEQSQRLLRIFGTGAEYLRETVRAHQIECQWREAGQIKGAVGHAAMPYLDGYCKSLDDHHMPYEDLDAGAMEAITGSSYYRAGILAPGKVLIQPAALARGLAATLPDNVEVIEETPVTAYHDGAPIRLDCAGGAVTTGGLLLTTNMYTPALGKFAKRIFPLFLFASLTRPMSESEVDALGGTPHWGIVPAHPAGTTVRRTTDHRILIRNTVRYAPDLASSEAQRQAARKHHVNSFRARFPMLPGVDFENTWSGGLCMTKNGGTVFEQVSGGVYASIAYNGLGISRGTASGMALAELASGHDSDNLRDVQAMPEASNKPPEALMNLAVPAYAKYMQWRGGAER